MSDENSMNLRDQYDDCIFKVNNLTNMIKQLSNGHELENLEEIVFEEDYLNLLANSLYSVNSLTYAYCNIKGLEFPSQFAKVKEYYNKAKNPLATESAKPAASSAPVVVNKQAAKRVIERSIK